MCKFAHDKKTPKEIGIYVSRVHGNWTYVVLTMLLNGDLSTKETRYLTKILTKNNPTKTFRKPWNCHSKILILNQIKSKHMKRTLELSFINLE